MCPSYRMECDIDLNKTQPLFPGQHQLIWTANCYKFFGELIVQGTPKISLTRASQRLACEIKSMSSYIMCNGRPITHGYLTFIRHRQRHFKYS